MSFRHAANNFDFIRIAAAMMVLCAHQCAVLCIPEPKPFGLFTLGTLGVLIFFSTSGYLVAQSWERDPNAWRFAARRFLRIWPGLAVVILLTVFFFGPAFTSLPLSDYFRSSATWAYLKYLYLQTSLYLPGVFEGNPWQVVNGSLWTILIEVKWYGLLLVGGMCGLLRPRFRYALLTLITLYVVYIYFVWDVQHNPRSAFPQPQFGCEYGTFFCYGALLHFMRHDWVGKTAMLLIVLLLLVCLLVILNYQYAAVYLCLPLVLVWFGGKSTPLLRQAGRFGDFSYGIYVYAYLIQQAVVSVLGLHHSYLVMLLVSLACTLICAVFSWYLVERPALALKRYLRGEAQCSESPGQTAALGTSA
jgi:peptidoglycan/LPS O-acetylase OafA/YrhL